MALVEFAMVLPFLALLYLGGLTVTQGIMANRKVIQLNFALGDLVAQDDDGKLYSGVKPASGSTPATTLNEPEAIFAAARSMLWPFPSDPKTVKMRISSVRIRANGTACMEWSYGKPAEFALTGDKGLGIGPLDVTTKVPEDLRIPGANYVMAETDYTYRPLIAFNILNYKGTDIEMSKIAFARARQFDRIEAPNLQPDTSACIP